MIYTSFNFLSAQFLLTTFHRRGAGGPGARGRSADRAARGLGISARGEELLFYVLAFIVLAVTKIFVFFQALYSR